MFRSSVPHLPFVNSIVPNKQLGDIKHLWLCLCNYTSSFRHFISLRTCLGVSCKESVIWSSRQLARWSTKVVIVAFCFSCSFWPNSPKCWGFLLVTCLWIPDSLKVSHYSLPWTAAAQSIEKGIVPASKYIINSLIPKSSSCIIIEVI